MAALKDNQFLVGSGGGRPIDYHHAGRDFHGSSFGLANSGRIPLEVIEVQTGSYLGEDDITRFDDVYKRS
jgi:hypothetical protein